jgi:hypothetical protein
MRSREGLYLALAVAVHAIARALVKWGTLGGDPKGAV